MRGGSVTERAKILLELAIVFLVLSAVIVLMRFESLRFTGWESSTFIGIPLLAGILLNLPAAELGLSFRRPLNSVKLFGLVCLVFLPPFLVAFYLYEYLANDAHIVLRVPEQLGRAAALHFLYFALPEEFLFRGYIQKRLGRVMPKILRFARIELPVAGVMAAALFAAAHVAYEASWYRILVFFPALVFAWLRYRTGSVLAPVLFHGTCNLVAYSAYAMLA